MKRISKILSVLMVSVLLFSIAAVPATAWDADTSTAIKYVFKDSEGNTISKANKGDIVYLHVVLNWNKNVYGFQGTFKFEKDALTLYHKSQAKAPTSLAQAVTYIGDFASSSQVSYDDMTAEQQEYDDNNNAMGYYAKYGAGTKSGNINCNITSWDDATNAKYQAITVLYASNYQEDVQQLIVNTNGTDLEYCKFRFLVNEDTELTEAVLSNDDAFSTMNSIDIPDDQDQLFANFATIVTTYVPKYEYATLTIATAPTIAVTHVKQQSKWNGGNANNTAENYLFSFVGQFTGIDVETTTETVDDVERKQVTNIESISAVATYSGTGKTAVADTIYTIWEVDGGYQFRAVFAGFEPTDGETVSVKFVVTMKDGTVYTESPYESDVESRVISDIYNASVNAGTGFPAVQA